MRKNLPAAQENLVKYKVGFALPMVIVSILPVAEFGPNDHQENAQLFTILEFSILYVVLITFMELYNETVCLRDL